MLWTLVLSLVFVGLAIASNATGHVREVASTTISTANGQIPLIFHHRTSAQKRHRRQYSEKAPPYEIRFLPYPAPPALRQARGSSQEALYGANGIESTTQQTSTASSSTTTSSTSAETSLTYPATAFTSPSYIPSSTSTQSYERPRPAITFVATHNSAYMVPPNGVPRDSNRGEASNPNNSNYFYPPRMPLPLSACFYNPTGYACCNAQLNDLMVETYSELEAKPTFHTCNINAIASMLQSKAEKRFNTTFETVAGFEDFAQKVHFNGDYICKIGGKFMLAYGTAKNAGGGSNGSGGSYNKYSGDTLKRQRRAVYGPENELPENHISKTHSMWI